MKTSACFISPVSLGVCVATVALFVTDLNAQNVRTNALAVATGDTNTLRESVAALQARVALSAAAVRAKAPSTNLIGTIESSGVMNAGQLPAWSPTAQHQFAMESSGNNLMSLTINNHLLNVDFGNNTKSGFAAIGQTANDYWNPYVMPYQSLGTLQNLLWSDQAASPVDVTVANAPGQWGNSLCVDPMYSSFIYPWDSGHITVTIAQLPANTYDFYVYATRASDFSPVTQFQRAGVTLWTKGATQWGKGW